MNSLFTKSLILVAITLAWIDGYAQSASTLRQTLRFAQAALHANDYEKAIEHFESIQTTFGEEPEVQAATFQVVVLPMHAYAALLTGDTRTSAKLFERFLSEFPEDRSRLAFVLFNLARAYEASGAIEESIRTYGRFIALDPDRPETALATLSAAKLMFKSGRHTEGFQALDALIEKQPAGVIRNKARLSALQEAIALGENKIARDYLLNELWSVTDMPELAVLAFSAMEMGQELMQEGAYAQAIQCYRLVLPYDALIKEQEARLIETRSRFASRKASIGLYQGGQFWTQFYANLLARIEQQLEALKSAEDYSPTLYLSLGQAYLLAGRPHEAWVLFETLSRDESLSIEIQAEAHYRWILASIDVGVWEDAFRIAKGFGERFPESPLVPDALFLLASAYQEAKQYRDAIRVLDHFLEKHSDHQLSARVLFVRGYNFNLLNEPALARQDFEAFEAEYPSHKLYQDARFWHALTFFSERDYPKTLDALESLESDINGHRLEPELAYRKAATLYAKKDYEQALASIEDYLNKYPRHLRFEEGRVLLGDIQMSRGELVQAQATFGSIEPSANHLFMYAVFQTGKILRAIAGAEDRQDTRKQILDAHLEHFRGYFERDDIPHKGRISEALYWIGWTYIERGEFAQARSIFEEALEAYGDKIEAEQVPNIIDALSRTEKRLTGLGRSDHESAFIEWVENEKETALESNRLTYYARLNLYLESMLPQNDSVGLIFDTVEAVPVERLDAESLGRIAAALVDRYPIIAADYLIRLEDDYPDSPHRVYAYYSRAALLMRESKFEQALAELGRFRSESPMHHLAISVTMRYASCLTQTERYEEARQALEEILRLRQAKGRPHAKALLALSRNEEASGKTKRAIPYAQRVYNVYRAYPDLAAEAYWMSAVQFENIGDHTSAVRTLDEMLADPRIHTLAITTKAKEKRKALEAIRQTNDFEDRRIKKETEVEVAL